MITARCTAANQSYEKCLFLVTRARADEAWVWGGNIPGQAGHITARGDPGTPDGPTNTPDPAFDVLSDIDNNDGDDEEPTTDERVALEGLFNESSTDPGDGGTFPVRPRIPATKVLLPPNLSSGFGGVDASAPIFSVDAFYTNLFDLNIGPDVGTTSLACPGPDPSSTSTTYTIPDYLNLTWGTYTDNFKVTGSTKREFTQDLTNHVKLDVNAMGFGAEFERTFSDNSTEETFHKYMARYDQVHIYKVALKNPDIASDHLTFDARVALEEWDADKVVDTFGTHFTTEASFGGVRIHSFTSDILNSFKESELKLAIDLKAPINSPSPGKADGAHAEADESDKKTQRLVDTMDAMQIRTLGGLAPEADTDLTNWRRTLFFNPVAVDYKLKPIYELLPPDHAKRAALTEEIQKRLAVTAPKDPFSLIAIRVPLKPYISDRDSQAYADLTVAWPDAPDGWLRVGQFAQSAKWENNNMTNDKGVAVRVNPNFDWEGKEPTVVSAVACTRAWKTRQNGVDFGIFRPLGPDKATDTNSNVLTVNEGLFFLQGTEPTYQPLGDFFEHTQSPEGVPSVSLESLAVFHKSLLKTAYTTDSNVRWLWDDSGTGGWPDITLLGAPQDLAEASPPHDRRTLVVGPGGAPAYIFKCVPRNTDHKSVEWKTLDWSKVKWLDNKFL
ncbi:hypothetical protein BCR34DRAFT_489297 [Clohesyomyces aquaticus]|uniref:MACPF domain-containing protein n=1 Tax=Clohesyomyces aquaticus TaxID=1231657 RepID=A0A1Y1ZCG5_9PLEO|nr:hypothetical protein BCR34DRAFT_489297 [Clohesyomyces aquaticus]